MRDASDSYKLLYVLCTVSKSWQSVWPPPLPEAALVLPKRFAATCIHLCTELSREDSWKLYGTVPGQKFFCPIYCIVRDQTFFLPTRLLVSRVCARA